MSDAPTGNKTWQTALYSVFPIRDTVLQVYMPPYMLKKGLDHDLYTGAPFIVFSPAP